MNALPPSIRELLEQQRALANTPQLAADLLALRGDLPVARQAAARLGVLWQLSQHLASWLRHGGTIVSPPPPAPKRPAQSLVPAPAPAAPRAAPAPPPATIAHPPAPAPDTVLTADQVCCLAGFSTARLYQLISAGRIPRASGRDGRLSTWRYADIAEPLAALVRRRRT